MKTSHLPNAEGLIHFANAIMACKALDKIIDVSLDEIEQTFALPHSEMWFFLERSHRLRCHSVHSEPTAFPRPTPISIDDHFIWNTLQQTERPLYITDWTKVDAATRDRAGKLHAHGLLTIPLHLKDVWLGFINCWCFEADCAVDKQQMLETVGKFIALKMDNLRRQRLNRVFALEVSAIQTVTETLSQPASLDTVFHSILRAALALGQAIDAHIFLYDGEKVSFGAALWADGRTETPFKTPRKNGLTYQVARSGETVAINSILNHPLFRRFSYEWDNDGAIIGVPLKIGERVVGVMNVAFDETHPFDPVEVEAFQVLAAQAAIAIANAQLFARAQSELAERERAERKLQQSEGKYRALIENSVDAVYLMVEGHYELVNHRFEEMFGVTLAQLNASDFGPNQLIASQSQPILLAEFEKRRKGLPLLPHVELRARHIDGHEFDIELSPSVFPYRGTEAIQGIIRDITDRKRMEKQLQYAQRMESVSELAGGIAHNFNNILTAITALSSLALTEIPDDNPLHSDLTIIRNQADRAAALVKKMLYFSQRKALDIHSLNLNGIIDSASQFLSQFAGVNIILKKNLGEALPLIRGDIGALEQILANITLNARDAMPNGGKLTIRTDTVWVTADNLPRPDVIPGEYVRLSAIDTGHGIAAEDLPRIFDPFFTTKEPGYNSGLGLAMVFGLMKQLNGFVQAHSEENMGTTIELCFPALPDTMLTDETPHPPEALRGGSERILLLETDDSVQRVVKRILENVDYVVFTAGDGETAISKLRTANPPIDMVITCIDLPDMTGQTLFTSVMALNLAVTPLFIFIICGGKSSANVLSAEITAQYPVLKKPYSPIMLTETIRKIMEVQ